MVWKNTSTWLERKEWALQKWWLYNHEECISLFSRSLALLLALGYLSVISWLLVHILSGGTNA